MKAYRLLLICILLAGCSPTLGSGTISPSPHPTLTVVQPTTTAISNVVTIMPLPTPSTTPLTSHPIHIPSGKDATEITLELLRNNNGCDLPCWWGIIPNQTSWNEAENFLKTFSDIYERQPPSEWFVYDISSPISSVFSEVGEVRAVFAAKNGLVKEIEISEFDEKTYHLSSFLQKYGIPTRVLISTYSSDYGLPPNQVSLSVNLYYPEKGINALYGTYATVKNSQISGCFEKSPHLFLWSPSENNRSIDYILGWDKNQTPYKDIQYAINLDLQGFYEKYKDPENTPCLQTPAGLWPGQ